MKNSYNECCDVNCERLTKYEFCRTCEEDKIRRETRDTVYDNDIDLDSVIDNRRVRG